MMESSASSTAKSKPARAAIRPRADTSRRLEALLDLVERKGIRSLTERDVSALGRTYRAVTSHLAVARSAGVSSTRIENLNRLALRAHAAIYRRSPRLSNTRSLGLFLRSVPAAVRSLWPFHLAAALCLLIGLTYGFFRTGVDPEWAATLAGPGEVRNPYATQQDLLDIIRRGRDSTVLEGEKAAFTSFLWQHNTRVGLVCFFSGFLAGIPTLLLDFHNGVLLGSMSAVHHQQGLAGAWWAWILPHGVTEMLAVVLLSGGGLAIGFTLLMPGRRRRIDALLGLRSRILPLLVLVFPMLLMAALIESYLRQSALEDGARTLVAVATLVFWTALIAFVPAPRMTLPADSTIAETRFPVPTEEEILWG